MTSAQTYTSSVKIEGEEKIQKLGERLDALGRGELRDRIGLAIWHAADPLRGKARQHATEILPRRGGLNLVVANTAIPISTRAKGRWRGVRLRVTADRENLRDPGAVNRGRVRHPVFGHVREPDGPLIQLVRPGWFTTPVVEGAPEVREKIIEIIDDELSKL